MPIADTVNLNQKIENRTFTVGWLLNSLRSNDEEYKKLYGDRGVREVISSDISKGKGFISIVARCIVKFVDSKDDSDIYSTILKIPCFEKLEQTQAKSEEGTMQCFDEEVQRHMIKLHAIECRFYNEMAPIFGIPVPKVFKTVEWIDGVQEGCLHMEDLTKKGQTISCFQNINRTQVKCFIRHLARWHRDTLCADSKIWKRKFVIKKINAFKKTFDKLSQNFLENSSMKPLLYPLISKYRKLAQNFDFFAYANKEGIEEIGIPEILVHGDMHAGNILYAVDENGETQNEIAAFLDWQTIREGSPMVDLARFLCLCADGVVRRQAEQFAIQYYFDCLVEEFGGDQSKIPYTIEQLRKAYSLAFCTIAIFGLGIAAFYMGVIEVPSQSIKNAYRDYGTLKAFHMLQDFDRLMDGEMKEIFEKYGK